MNKREAIPRPISSHFMPQHTIRSPSVKRLYNTFSTFFDISS